MKSFMIGCILFLAAPMALAETTAPTASTAPKGQVVGVGNDGAHAIGLLLRCPVCQGMPISDSPADMAQSMMGKVRSMHSEGKSEEEILKYFTDRYGDWVLLKPKVSGFNWLVWGLPPIVLLLGLAGALLRSKSKQAAAPNSSAASDASAESTQDEYLKAIRNEVEL